MVALTIAQYTNIIGVMKQGFKNVDKAFRGNDRIERSMTKGSELVNNLIKRGIMDNTPSSKVIRNIFFSFAEFERDMIVERTQEGKVIAKTKKGFKEVRPKVYTKKQLDIAIKMLIINS